MVGGRSAQAVGPGAGAAPYGACKEMEPGPPTLAPPPSAAPVDAAILFVWASAQAKVAQSCGCESEESGRKNKIRLRREVPQWIGDERGEGPLLWNGRLPGRAFCLSPWGSRAERSCPALKTIRR